MELAKRRIVLGVTGGIAAYKSCELVRRMRDEGADVQVVMTPAARQFVGTATFQALTGKPVFDDLWDGRVPDAMGHIELSRGADAILVAPASADFLAKLANGLCDDLLSTMVLASRRSSCRLLVAPAMNVEMWEHPATRRNVATLVADGARVLGPAVGDQACGETGAGRMLEPAEILAELIASFHERSLAGRRVLVTAGPTYEPIDPVRGITNRSSGKMGYAIARAAWEAGAEVTLVSGPTALARPFGVRRIAVESAQQMLDRVLDEVDAADVFVAVAAVADWRIAAPSPVKLKKRASAEPPTLQLANNPDILATVSSLPSPPCAWVSPQRAKTSWNTRAPRSARRPWPSSLRTCFRNRLAATKRNCCWSTLRRHVPLRALPSSSRGAGLSRRSRNAWQLRSMSRKRRARRRCKENTLHERR
jgi:phosphopantothenoylcysteine decarboxylase/phosphopantothenate--cysteine ligase